jgi:nitrogen fixation protein NifU and related proteins
LRLAWRVAMAGYSETVLDHFRSPRNVGRLEPCDASGVCGTPGNGPFVVFTARLAEGRIAEVRFQTFGCGPAIAAGSVLTELVTGRSLADTSTLSRDDLLAALGGLPEEKLYCADLAVEAWHNLVGDGRAGKGGRGG